MLERMYKKLVVMRCSLCGFPSGFRRPEGGSDSKRRGIKFDGAELGAFFGIPNKPGDQPWKSIFDPEDPFRPRSEAVLQQKNVAVLLQSRDFKAPLRRFRAF